MPLEPTFKSLDESLIDMLRWYQHRTGIEPDTEDGAILKTIFEAVGFEVEARSFAFDTQLLAAVSEAYADALGLEPEDDTKATLTLRFSRALAATEDTVVPAGSGGQTVSGIGFITLEDATIFVGQTYADALAEAVTSGANGNVDAGTVTTLTSLVPGVEAVTNTSAGANGKDAETDAERNERLALALARLAKGTPPAVTATALTASTTLGEKATQVLAVDNYLDATIPPGEGRVYLYRPGGAGAALIAAVAAALELEEMRPIGAKLTVLAVALVTSNVTLALTGSDAGASARADEAARAFFDELEVGEDVNLNRLIGRIEQDDTLYTATGTLSLTAVGAYERAELGTLTITFTAGGAA